MTAMLDVAVGLIFVYLLLSLLTSAVAEGLEHHLRYRADYLRQGVEQLLLGGDTAMADKLYAHPLIKSLYTASWWEGKGRAGGPSYIPARQFVLALLDLVAKPAAPGTSASSAGGGSAATGHTSVEQLLAAIDASEKDKRVPAALAGALRTLIADAGHDMEKVKANVQEWFDGSMDRVAGWYKRRAQFLLLIIGAVVVVGVNVDTLEIVRTLSNDSAVRAAVVAAAETYARENPRPGTPANQTAATPGQPASPQGQPAGNMSPVGPEAPRVSSAEATADVKRSVADVVTQLNTLGLPVGWRYYDRAIDGPIIERADPAARRKYLLEQRIWPQWPGSQTSSGQSWAVRFGAWQQDWRDQLASHLLGWILTAFALSFGAPFWFDTLNKIMVIRSTVKPREKSQEEASEDRQRAEPAQTVRIEVATKP